MGNIKLMGYEIYDPTQTPHTLVATVASFPRKKNTFHYPGQRPFRFEPVPDNIGLRSSRIKRMADFWPVGGVEATYGRSVSGGGRGGVSSFSSAFKFSFCFLSRGRWWATRREISCSRPDRGPRRQAPRGISPLKLSNGNGSLSDHCSPEYFITKRQRV